MGQNSGSSSSWSVSLVSAIDHLVGERFPLRCEPRMPGTVVLRVSFRRDAPLWAGRPLRRSSGEGRGEEVLHEVEEGRREVGRHRLSHLV
jgi:hypothetical protein